MGRLPTNRHRKSITLTFDPDVLDRLRLFLAARKGNNLSAWLESLALNDAEFQAFEKEPKQ